MQFVLLFFPVVRIHKAIEKSTQHRGEHLNITLSLKPYKEHNVQTGKHNNTRKETNI